MDEQIERDKRMLVGWGCNLTACTVAAVLMDGAPTVQAMLGFLAVACAVFMAPVLWRLFRRDDGVSA